MKQTSLTKGAIFQTAGKFLLEGIAFFTAPIFTRILSPVDYGKMSVYSTWCSLVTLFIGLQVYGSIANAKIEYSEEDLSGYMSSIMALAFIPFIAFFLLVLVLCRPLATFINVRTDLVILLVIQSFAAFCIEFYNTKLIQSKRADKSMYLLTAISLLSIALSLIFVLTFNGEKYILKIYGNAIPTVIIGFVLCVYILIKGKTYVNKKYWSFCLVLTLPLIFHSAGHLILGQSDRIMLQKMIGESETGIYSISATVSMVMTTIFASFNNAWVPYYYEYKKNDDIKSILVHSRNYMIVIVLLYIGFLLVVPEVFKILVPPFYWKTGLKVIPILTLSSFFRYLYLFPANHELYNKETKLIAVGTFLSALVNIGLNFIFIKYFDTIGASIATCVSSCILFIFQLLLARKVVKGFEYPIIFFLPGTLLVCITFILYFAIANYWILRWCLAIFVGIILIIRLIKNRSLF